MAYDIGPKIGIDGEKQFRDELNNITQQLKTLGTEMKAVSSEFDDNDQSQEKLTAQAKVLNKQIDLQEEKLAKLREGLEKSADMYGENDTKTLKWKSTVNTATADLNKMRRQLEKTEDAMDDLGGETDDLKRDLGDLGDAAGDVSLNDVLGQLGDLKKMLKGGAAALGLDVLKDALFGVVEETKEYRSIMGTLETSSAAAGYSTEQMEEAYMRLYGVLGDTQTTATAVANLQAIGLNQGDLMSIIDMATGAWAKYGDSIPIDGLAESIKETITSGEVTGTFADVLNRGAQEGETYGVKLRENNEANKEWNDAVNDCKTAEDYFNLALSECQTEAERTDLLMQVMADQGLSDLAEAWRTNNGDIETMNESEAKLQEAMGDLGELLTPLAADLTSFAADALGSLIQGAKDAWQWFKDLNQKLNEHSEARRKAAQAPKPVDVPKYSPQEAMDGYHADGLYRVPFNGYRAVLHKDERILTAREASALDALQQGMARPMAAAQTSGLERALTNALRQSGSGGAAVPIEITLISKPTLDGRVIGESVTKYQLRTGKAEGR